MSRRQEIRDIGPGKAAYTGVLIPVIAMLISTAFEGYEWSLLSVSGAALAMTRPGLHLPAEPIYLRPPDISQPKPRP